MTSYAYGGFPSVFTIPGPTGPIGPTGTSDWVNYDADTIYYDGKVGINTTTPNLAYKLDVNGNANFGNVNVSGDITTGTLTIANISTGNGTFSGNLSVSGNTTTGKISATNTTGNVLELQGVGSGRVQLQLKDDIGADMGYIQADSSQHSYYMKSAFSSIGIPSAGRFQVVRDLYGAGQSNSFQIDASDNTFIKGTLVASGTSTTEDRSTLITKNSQYAYQRFNGNLSTAQGFYDLRLDTATQQLEFAPNASLQSITINPSGKVGINGNPSLYNLEVSGNIHVTTIDTTDMNVSNNISTANINITDTASLASLSVANVSVSNNASITNTATTANLVVSTMANITSVRGTGGITTFNDDTSERTTSINKNTGYSWIRQSGNTGGYYYDLRNEVSSGEWQLYTSGGYTCMKAYGGTGYIQFPNKVGIGITPTSRALDVIGSGYFSSHLDISGSFTATSGSITGYNLVSQTSIAGASSSITGTGSFGNTLTVSQGGASITNTGGNVLNLQGTGSGRVQLSLRDDSGTETGYFQASTSDHVYKMGATTNTIAIPLSGSFNIVKDLYGASQANLFSIDNTNKITINGLLYNSGSASGVGAGFGSQDMYDYTGYNTGSAWQDTPTRGVYQFDGTPNAFDFYGDTSNGVYYKQGAGLTIRNGDTSSAVSSTAPLSVPLRFAVPESASGNTIAIGEMSSYCYSRATYLWGSGGLNFSVGTQTGRGWYGLQSIMCMDLARGFIVKPSTSTTYPYMNLLDPTQSGNLTLNLHTGTGSTNAKILNTQSDNSGGVEIFGGAVSRFAVEPPNANNASIHFDNQTTAGTAGSISAYLPVVVNGTSYKLPLYAL